MLDERYKGGGNDGMTGLQEMLIGNNLIKLFNMYEKYYKGEIFRRLLYKQIINMPESVYSSKMKYDIKVSIEEDSQFRMGFLEDWEKVHYQALVVSGSRNVNKMVKAIIDNMGECRIYNFFREAKDVLIDEGVVQEDKDMIIEMFRGVSETLGMNMTLDKQNKKNMDLLSEEERLILEMGSLFCSGNKVEK